MNNVKIEKLLDDLTLGLKADPEIRLDVKSELRSHLDAKIEEGIQASLSEEESEKQALKSFGDTIQISDGIASANSSKMSFKARLKVFAGFLLIPAVIICALISFEHSILGIMLSSNTLIGPNAYVDALTRNKNKMFWSFQKYTQEEKLILYGDKSKKSKVEQQKAIWERFPENKVYLGHYILTLLASKKDTDAWRKKMFTELKMAEKKDPDNSLYNYISAGLLFEKACKIKISSKPIHININVIDLDNKTRNRKYRIKIKDRKLLEQAIEEYLKGTQKNYFKSYTIDMLHNRFNILGEPRNTFENLHQIAIAAGTLLPHMNYLRNIAQASLMYAEVLQKEGKQLKALRIVKPWKIYLKQITGDSNHLISILVDMAIAEFDENKIPAFYRKAGKTKLAKVTERELNKITVVKKQWKNEGPKELSRNRLDKTGILSGILLPTIGKLDYTEEDLSISNKIEYTALEKAGIILLNLLFLIAMIGCGLTALYWRIRSKQKALLLAPPPKLVAKVFLMGIIVPLTAYILISISGTIGGHMYNIASNAINLSAQFIILLTIIPAIIFILIKKHVRQRCLEIGISYPAKKKKTFRKIILLAIFSLTVLLALSPLQNALPLHDFPRSIFSVYIPLLIVLLIVIPMCFLVANIIITITEYFTTIFSGTQYALYYGALAKTIVPVFALAMIFMTLVILPFLNWREADLISRDKVMYGKPKSFTHVEHQLAQRLKTAILKALE